VPLDSLEISERMGVIFLSYFSSMLISVTTLLATLSSIFRSRAAFGLENPALRHPIGVLQKSAIKRAKFVLAGPVLTETSGPSLPGLPVVENPQHGALQPGRRHYKRAGGLANHSDPLEGKRFIPPASGQTLATSLL
jgi:hypothetical protein